LEIAEHLLGPLLHHPDFLHVNDREEGKSIKIETIREVIQRLSLKPVKSERTVIIIEDAETLTEAAANALLKTLEEPPSYVLFLLLSTAPEKFPTTIRSRCQKIIFQVSSEALRNRVQTLFLDWQQQITALFEGHPSFSQVSKIAEALAKGKENLNGFFEALKILWHDGTLWKNTNSQEYLLLNENLSMIQKISEKKTGKSFFTDMDLILETERAIEGNVNKTLALERLFVTLTA